MWLTKENLALLLCLIIKVHVQLHEMLGKNDCRFQTNILSMIYLQKSFLKKNLQLFIM